MEHLRRLVDRSVDPAQVREDAPRGDDPLPALPDLVVDHVHAVVSGGGQVAPRVALQHRVRANFDWYSSAVWTLSTYAQTVLWDDEGALSLGFYLQRSF